MSDTYPAQQDDERAVVDVLAAVLPGIGEDVTVTVGGPVTGWRPSSRPHIKVTSDGTPSIDNVSTRATVRCTAYAGSTTEAKRLAALAQAVLVARYDLINAVALTGVLAARDDDTGAEIAMTTVQVAAVLA